MPLKTNSRLLFPNVADSMYDVSSDIFCTKFIPRQTRRSIDYAKKEDTRDTHYAWQNTRNAEITFGVTRYRQTPPPYKTGYLHDRRDWLRASGYRFNSLLIHRFFDSVERGGGGGVVAGGNLTTNLNLVSLYDTWVQCLASLSGGGGNPQFAVPDRRTDVFDGCYDCFDKWGAYKASNLDQFFGTTPATEKGYEFWTYGGKQKCIRDFGGET
jgi:hypothetical protein